MTAARSRFDLSVGQRLLLGFTAAGALLVLLVVASVHWIERVTELRARLETVIAPRAAVADQLEAAIFQAGISARSFALGHQQQDAEKFGRAAADVRGTLDRLGALANDPPGRVLLRDIRPRVGRFVPAAEALVSLAASRAEPRRIGEAERALTASRDELLVAVRAYSAHQDRRTVEVREEISAAVSRMERGIAVLAPLVLALLAATAFLTTRGVRRPALRLLDAARALAAGDDGPAAALAPEGAVPERRRDELAELSSAFGSMALALRAREQRLQRLAADLQTGRERLQAQNEELQAQSEELQAQHEQLHSQNEELQAQREELERQAQELRRTVEALTESEERFRRAVTDAPFPIMIHAEDGRVLQLSRAWTELSGWTPEELPTTAAWLEKARGDGPDAPGTAGGEGEITIRTKDGRERIWELATARLGRLQGERVIVSMANDVTERKRAEKALREADRRKDEFLATLSHELRNPLAPIRNGLYVLDRAAPGSESARRARAAMDRQVRHLTRLVDDLLDVTRVSRGKFNLCRVSVNLVQMLQEVADDLREQFAASRIDFRVSLPGKRLWVNGDPARLSQIAGNLLHNAAKFTPPGGRVDLELEEAPDGRTALLRVRDSGVGIEPALLERIFEPFVQVETTLARTYGGLGLGLALVKALTEYHGGRVEARSAGPGTGAEFRVHLPLEGQPVRAVAPVSVRGAAPRRILIVEDNVDSAETLREVLRLGGHDVAVALDGEEALRKAKELQPDAILCDIGLPGMTGYDVARAVRKDAALSGAFLVALTGYALPDDRRKGAEAGFDEYLAKPLTLERLEELLLRVPDRAVRQGATGA